MKRSPSRYTTAPKRDKIPQKAGSLLVHIGELSTAVVKVDIKVINASLMFTMGNAALNAC